MSSHTSDEEVVAPPPAPTMLRTVPLPLVAPVVSAPLLGPVPTPVRTDEDIEVALLDVALMPTEHRTLEQRALMAWAACRRYACASADMDFDSAFLFAQFVRLPEAKHMFVVFAPSVGMAGIVAAAVNERATLCIARSGVTQEMATECVRTYRNSVWWAPYGELRYAHLSDAYKGRAVLLIDVHLWPVTQHPWLEQALAHGGVYGVSQCETVFSYQQPGAWSQVLLSFNREATTLLNEATGGAGFRHGDGKRHRIYVYHPRFRQKSRFPPLDDPWKL